MTKTPNYQSVTLFASFVVSIDSAIKDDAEKGRLYTAIAHYSLYGEEPELDGVSAALFELMRPNIDTSNKRRSAGKKGGETIKTQANCKQNESKLQAKNKQNTSNPETMPSIGIGIGIGDRLGESINTFKENHRPYSEPEKDKVQETCEVVKEFYPRCNYPILADRATVAALKRIAQEKEIDITGACEYLQERVKLFAECKYGADKQYLPEANNWLDNGGYNANENSWIKGTENGNEQRYVPENF